MTHKRNLKKGNRIDLKKNQNSPTEKFRFRKRDLKYLCWAGYFWIFFWKFNHKRFNVLANFWRCNHTKNMHQLIVINCSRRLTGIVFARSLSLRARAPSSCSVCEYLKEVNIGAPLRPFALRRSSQLARNIKGDTPLRGGRKNCTESLKLCH